MSTWEPIKNALAELGLNDLLAELASNRGASGASGSADAATAHFIGVIRAGLAAKVDNPTCAPTGPGPSSERLPAAKKQKCDVTPSSLADAGTWREVQSAEAPFFLCYRPDRRSIGLPVALLDESLDELACMFAEAMAGQGEPPSIEDCSVTTDLCEAMPKGFPNELARVAAFNAIFGSYVDDPLESHHPNPMNPAYTDGGIIVAVKVIRKLFAVPVYIQEAKVEVGAAGDPYFEGQRYYQLHLENENLQAVLQHSVLPVLFVELVGPQLRVSALASPEGRRVVCEPLTPFLHLFMMTASQPGYMDRLARVLRAVKDGVALLKSKWLKWGKAQRAAPPAIPPRDPSLKLPYPLRPGAGFRKAEPSPFGKLVYEAVDEESGEEVLVKFARLPEQAMRVHEAWAAEGLAPKLIIAKVRRLLCGLTMIVIERLREEDGWTMFYSLSVQQKKQLNDAVLRKLQQAHDVVVDGAKAVHGDMRQANVMVRLGSDGQPVDPPQVRFVDFDWSGLQGRVRLPSFARERLPGIGPGVEITQQYDKDLWLHEMTNGPL